jgi:kumamolisin
MADDRPGFRDLPGSARPVRKGASRVSPADPNETAVVSIYLRRPPGAAPLLGQDYFIAQPFGRRDHISRAELATRHGATPEDMKIVTDFATARSFTIVETNPARRLVRVSGTLARFADAFSVQLFHYRSTKETYRGHEGPIRLPAEIANIVEGVFGLDNRIMARRSSFGGGAGNLTPPQVAAAYNFPSPPNGATGQTVAVLEFSGPISSGFNTAGFLQSDIDAYINGLNSSAGSNLNSTNVVTVVIDQSNDAPGNVLSGTAMNPTDEDTEVALDLEIIVSVAQGAGVVAYFAPGTEQGWVDAITTIVADTANNPSVLSISWGWSELQADAFLDPAGPPPGPWPFEWSQQAFDQMTRAFQDAANIGMTVFAASGDFGSDCGENDGHAHVMYPTTDPWVTSCGGTIITSLSPLAEDTWNDSYVDAIFFNGGVTGGGVSYLVGPQPWQGNASVPLSLNPDHHHGRGVPDIAGNASTFSGYVLWIYGKSTIVPVGGTSAVGPLYAALVALINATLTARVGYLNPMLYALGGTPVFRDINDGLTNSESWWDAAGDNVDGPSPGYVSGPGWDACTGWGSIDGTALMTAVQQGSQKDCYFVVDWSTYIKQGISEMLNQANPAVFPDAFHIVVEGFTATDLAVGTALAVQPVLTFTPQMPTGMSVQLAGPAIQDGSQLRFTFRYDVAFSGVTGFPTPPAELTNITIAASVTGAVTSWVVTSSAVIALSGQSSPFMVPGPISWLSNDIRVFQLEPGGSPPWLQNLTNALKTANIPLNVVLGNTGVPTTDATAFITNVILGFNAIAATALPTKHPFDGIATDENVSVLDTLPTDPASGNPVYNFAVARVRYQDPAADAKNVRVFFRTFPALAVSTAYEPTTTYRRWSDGNEFGNTISLLGSQFSLAAGAQLETIPFFANRRIDTTAASMDTQLDEPNVRTMTHDPANAVVYAYFGCWLDLNQPSQTPFPRTPASDGPFTGTSANPLVPVSTLLANQHQCITVEIAYDPIPISPGATPGSSSMLGQRNLSLLPVANPGDPATRRVSCAFEIQARPRPLSPGDSLDVLMIDWGNLPSGSIATLYLPAADAMTSVKEAAKLSGPQKLTLVDAHTLQFVASGISHIPIPPGQGANLAALLSVEVPPGIRKGQEFNAVVRHIVATAGQGGPKPKSMQVLGSFGLKIPVLTRQEMLAPDKRLLSTFADITKACSKYSRWYPILIRYTQHISERVAAL